MEKAKIERQYQAYTERMTIKGFEFLIVPFKEFKEAILRVGTGSIGIA